MKQNMDFLFQQINKILVEEGIGTLIPFSSMSAAISAIKSIFLEEKFS